MERGIIGGDVWICLTLLYPCRFLITPYFFFDQHENYTSFSYGRFFLVCLEMLRIYGRKFKVVLSYGRLYIQPYPELPFLSRSLYYGRMNPLYT